LRYFIQFSYFGKAYHGWQKQPNAITVQEVLEHSLSILMRKRIQVVGAGRTDAGVHAREMHAHFDFTEIKDAIDLVYRLNAFLPDDIAVQGIYLMQDDAHARFDALERSYEYWLCDDKNPFLTEAAHYIKHPLDTLLMNNAAELLLGKQDFECFSKSKTEVNNHFCRIKSAHWSVESEYVVFKITADRFLRNMVRAIVGTLLDVGTGKSSLDTVKTIIKSKDRTIAGVSVPAKGLYLTAVSYPNTIFKK
jgi:tRNA pseudouridine38-40 synthase